MCFWLPFRSELCLLHTPFLFTLACFLLTFSLPLSHLECIWCGCDSSPTMGQPVLGLDVRLRGASANVAGRGNVLYWNAAFTHYCCASSEWLLCYTENWLLKISVTPMHEFWHVYFRRSTRLSSSVQPLHDLRSADNEPIWALKQDGDL